MGFHLLVWCPKCTPASSNCFIEITLMSTFLRLVFSSIHRTGSMTPRPSDLPPPYGSTNRNSAYVFFDNACILPQFSRQCKSKINFLVTVQPSPKTGFNFSPHQTSARHAPLPALRDLIRYLLLRLPHRYLITPDGYSLIIPVLTQKYIKLGCGSH